MDIFSYFRIISLGDIGLKVSPYPRFTLDLTVLYVSDLYNTIAHRTGLESLFSELKSPQIAD
jgi:hypothetical protein